MNNVSPTIKQSNAVNNLVENGGNISKAMRDAKYSPKTAKTPKKLTESAGGKLLLEPIVKKWLVERERLTQALSEKDLSKENLRDTMDAIDKLTKNIQLLSGNITENIQLSGVEINVRK